MECGHGQHFQHSGIDKGESRVPFHNRFGVPVEMRLYTVYGANLCAPVATPLDVL